MRAPENTKALGQAVLVARKQPIDIAPSDAATGFGAWKALLASGQVIGGDRRARTVDREKSRSGQALHEIISGRLRWISRGMRSTVSRACDFQATRPSTHRAVQQTLHRKVLKDLVERRSCFPGDIQQALVYRGGDILAGRFRHRSASRYGRITFSTRHTFAYSISFLGFGLC